MKDFYLSSEELAQTARKYVLEYPEHAEAALQIADHACRNEFIIPYTNDLSTWIPMGTPVNWLYNPSRDPEFTWGINRHWHMLDLGKAYLMNGNEKYVTVYIEHFRSWREQNPVPQSISYEEAVYFQQLGPWRLLENGLRVQSWITAYKYMEGSPQLNGEFLGELKEALAEHAEYLTRYLGDTHINHAMMHMQGLFMIATFCPEHERAPYWRQLAVERLELCLVHQIGPEGIQSELTTHYHDASIEMFGTPYLLGRLSGHPFPASYEEQLARMAAFTEAMIRPDGRSTPLGDSNLISHGQSNLALLGAILQREDLISRGSVSPELLWMFGTEQFDRFRELQNSGRPEMTSVAFPQTGYYVMRDTRQYIFLDAAPMGGAHGHADALAMEWVWNKQLIFADPGRYTYEEGQWRHYFKSTRAHTTVTVDSLDQTPYLTTQAWGEPEAKAAAHRWESGESYHFIDASHDGYMRLDSPVLHRRWLLASTELPLLMLVDWLETDGGHAIEQRFQLLPEAKVRVLAGEGDCPHAHLDYPGTSLGVDLYWKAAGSLAGGLRDRRGNRLDFGDIRLQGGSAGHKCPAIHEWNGRYYGGICSCRLCGP